MIHSRSSRVSGSVLSDKRDIKGLPSLGVLPKNSKENEEEMLCGRMCELGSDTDHKFPSQQRQSVPESLAYVHVLKYCFLNSTSYLADCQGSQRTKTK